MREHGTRAKYVHDRCKCLRCRQANSRYQCSRYARTRRPYRVRHIYGGHWLVISIDRGETVFRSQDRAEAFAKRNALNGKEGRGLRDPLWQPQIAAVRKHFQNLAEHGISLRQLSRLTGISRTRLQEIKGNYIVESLSTGGSEMKLSNRAFDGEGNAMVEIPDTGICLSQAEATKCESCANGITLFPMAEDGSDARFTGTKKIVWSHADGDCTWPCARLEPEEHAKTVLEWERLTDAEREALYG
jgi:hypothetical protein